MRWVVALVWVVVANGCDWGLGLDERVPPAPPPPKWIAVATGAAQSCAIDEARALWCWGANSSGQIGDGTAWRFDLARSHDSLRAS